MSEYLVAAVVCSLCTVLAYYAWLCVTAGVPSAKVPKRDTVAARKRGGAARLGKDTVPIGVQVSSRNTSPLDVGSTAIQEKTKSNSKSDDHGSMDAKQPVGGQTPMDVFEARKSQFDGEGKKMAALVTTGSLNPIHSGHVRQLELAAHALENKGYAVVAGWISPSDAGWSRGKPHGSIGNAHKLAMVELAVAGHPWIRCSRWEIDNGMVDYPVVVNHVKKVVGKDVEVFYVCGSDHATKCWLHNKSWAVVIGRPGHELPPGTYSCTYIATKEGDSDVSSTMIRAAAEKQALDSVQHMVHPDVFEYLKNHRNEIWGE